MTQSTRTNLEEQLPVLAQKIKKFRERSETIGESNTKAALIGPLLEALGWDVTDPDEVFREYKSKPQDNPVDYALLLLRSPRLFIEAKALSKKLSDRKWISQILLYATMAGVEWCVLTNGDEYRIYNAHAPVDVEKKLFRSVRISDPDKTAFTIETLNLLSKDKLDDNLLAIHWKAHFIDRRVNTALEKILQNDDPGLIRLIRKKTPGLKPAEIRDSLRRADIRIDFPIAPQDTTPVPQQIERVEKVTQEPKKKGVKLHGVKVIDLLKAGFIHAPLKLQKKYKGVNLEAEIQESGQVVFDGVPYKSLSLAASMARKSIIGAPPGHKYPQTNGWIFWNYYDTEVGALVEIDRPRQQYLKQVREPGFSAAPEEDEYDTIVVPASEEGFHETFLGENCWYAIRMASVMIDRVRYIAAYQTTPVSAITHYAEVARIERYKDTGKYIVYFKEPAKEIGPIKLPEGTTGQAPQGPRYTNFQKLLNARTLSDIF